MIDETAIEAEIVSRNRLRQQSGLPSLNADAERARLRAVAVRREYEAACRDHWPLFEAIRAETEAEAGLSPSTGWISRLGIHALVRRRFEARLAREFGIARPA
jgi:hypothetical protein